MGIQNDHYKDPFKKNHTSTKHAKSKILGESKVSQKAQIMKASLRQFY